MMTSMHGNVNVTLDSSRTMWFKNTLRQRLV